MEIRRYTYDGEITWRYASETGGFSKLSVFEDVVEAVDYESQRHTILIRDGRPKMAIE